MGLSLRRGANCPLTVLYIIVYLYCNDCPLFGQHTPQSRKVLTALPTIDICRASGSYTRLPAEWTSSLSGQGARHYPLGRCKYGSLGKVFCGYCGSHYSRNPSAKAGRGDGGGGNASTQVPGKLGGLPYPSACDDILAPLDSRTGRDHTLMGSMVVLCQFQQAFTTG